MFGIHSKLTQWSKQRANATHSEEKDQPTETDLAMAEMLEPACIF